MLIDTHAHLTWDCFRPNFDAVVQRALEKGVKTVINVGADLESSQKALRLAQGKQPSGISFYSTIGLHPHEVSRLPNDKSLPDRPAGGPAGRQGIHQYIKKLEKIYHDYPQKVVAVGECGLDYHFEGNLDHSPTDLSQDKQIILQKKLFQAQIDLALKLNLPLVIHSRNSSNGAVSVWKDIFSFPLGQTTGVFHSFTGSLPEAQKALDLGYYLGFTCVVTYPKNESLRQIIKGIPLNKILTETDCPFLPPQNMRGQRNEPANVSQVVETIAQIKDLKYEVVAQAVWENARRLFSHFTV